MGLAWFLLQVAAANAPAPATVTPLLVLPPTPVATEKQVARANECAAHYGYAALLIPLAASTALDATPQSRALAAGQGAMFGLRAREILFRVGRLQTTSDYLPQDILDRASTLFEETLQRKGKSPSSEEKTIAACDAEYGFLIVEPPSPAPVPESLPASNNEKGPTPP